MKNCKDSQGVCKCSFYLFIYFPLSKRLQKPGALTEIGMANLQSKRTRGAENNTCSGYNGLIVVVVSQAEI